MNFFRTFQFAGIFKTDKTAEPNTREITSLNHVASEKRIFAFLSLRVLIIFFRTWIRFMKTVGFLFGARVDIFFKLIGQIYQLSLTTDTDCQYT
jgi:hypothetical protein